jgi:hypothetical protein
MLILQAVNPDSDRINYNNYERRDVLKGLAMLPLGGG